MVSKLFVVFDSKANAYAPPICLRSTGEGERYLTDLVMDDKSTVHRYPEDFTLFEIGTYDHQSAVIQLYEAKRSIGIAAQFKASAIEAARSFGQPQSIHQ